LSDFTFTDVISMCLVGSCQCRLFCLGVLWNWNCLIILAVYVSQINDWLMIDWLIVLEVVIFTEKAQWRIKRGRVEMEPLPFDMLKVISNYCDGNNGTYLTRALGQRRPSPERIRSASGVLILSPELDQESGSGSLSKCNGGFLVRSYISDEIFMKIRSVVFTWDR